MTVIIGMETATGVVMGADRAVTFGYTVEIVPWPKIFTRLGFLIGLAGDPRIRSLLLYEDWEMPDMTLSAEAKVVRYLAEPLAEMLERRKISTFEEGKQKWNGQLLVGVAGQLYQVDGSFCVHRTLAGFMAVGAAEDIALGAMAALDRFAPRKRVQRALEICGEHNIVVRRPYDVIEQGKE